MYTTIIHPLRKALMLSCNEYMVLDTIYVLSNNDKGCCYASKQRIANDLDMSKRTVIRCVGTLIKKGLIFGDRQSSHLRPTPLWRELMSNKSDYAIAINTQDAAIISAKIQGVTASHTPVTPSPNGGESLSHNNNTITNYNNKDTLSSVSVFEKEKTTINSKGIDRARKNPQARPLQNRKNDLWRELVTVANKYNADKKNSKTVTNEIAQKFYEHYTQPSEQDENRMLFETKGAWKTENRFRGWMADQREPKEYDY